MLLTGDGIYFECDLQTEREGGGSPQFLVFADADLLWGGFKGTKRITNISSRVVAEVYNLVFGINSSELGLIKKAENSWGDEAGDFICHIYNSQLKNDKIVVDVFDCGTPVEDVMGRYAVDGRENEYSFIIDDIFEGAVIDATLDKLFSYCGRNNVSDVFLLTNERSILLNKCSSILGGANIPVVPELTALIVPNPNGNELMGIDAGSYSLILMENISKIPKSISFPYRSKIGTVYEGDDSVEDIMSFNYYDSEALV